MSNEMSESGWTMYLDLSVDRWSTENASGFHIEKQQTKKSKYKHDTDRYRTYNHQESSNEGNEEGSSMASDASSAPQNLSVPLWDLEFGQGQQAAESFFSGSRRRRHSVSRRRRDVHNKQDDLESIASRSAVDVNLREDKLRKVEEDEHALLIQDTASSDVHGLDVCFKIYGFFIAQ